MLCLNYKRLTINILNQFKSKKSLKWQVAGEGEGEYCFFPAAKIKIKWIMNSITTEHSYCIWPQM
jgi:hypothetical protein